MDGVMDGMMGMGAGWMLAGLLLLVVLLVVITWLVKLAKK